MGPYTEKPGPRSLGLGCLVPDALHPYLDWLFHTLVKEIERASPLHPEEKEGQDLFMVWDGGHDKADLLTVFPERDGKSPGS